MPHPLTQWDTPMPPASKCWPWRSFNSTLNHHPSHLDKEDRVAAALAQRQEAPAVGYTLLLTWRQRVLHLLQEGLRTEEAA